MDSTSNSYLHSTFLRSFVANDQVLSKPIKPKVSTSVLAQEYFFRDFSMEEPPLVDSKAKLSKSQLNDFAFGIHHLSSTNKK